MLERPGNGLLRTKALERIRYGCRRSGALPPGRGRTVRLGIWASALLFVAGCGIGSERKDPLELQVDKLQQQKAEVAADLERSQVENRQLQEQIRAMAALPRDNGENPYKLVKVRIGRYTNFYDRDDDGRREKLIVYVQPVDENGDAIKAAGTVNVQLWDLSDPNSQGVIGQWQVMPSELRQQWFSSLLIGYRLAFDVPATPELLAHPLTVRVVFTDYLTGEIFRDQHVIKPNAD